MAEDVKDVVEMRKRCACSARIRAVASSVGKVGALLPAVASSSETAVTAASS